MTERAGYDDVLCSSVSDARFLVIETGTADGMPALNGVPMFRATRQACSTAKDPAIRSNLRGGRRYVDIATGLTLLCVWPGHGLLSYEGRRLTLASDRRPRLTVAAGRTRGGRGARAGA